MVTECYVCSRSSEGPVARVGGIPYCQTCRPAERDVAPRTAPERAVLGQPTKEEKEEGKDLVKVFDMPPATGRTFRISLTRPGTDPLALGSVTEYLLRDLLDRGGPTLLTALGSWSGQVGKMRGALTWHEVLSQADVVESFAKVRELDENVTVVRLPRGPRFVDMLVFDLSLPARIQPMPEPAPLHFLTCQDDHHDCPFCSLGKKVRTDWFGSIPVNEL